MADSDHQSTHSGALIGSSDDILTEILLRLPATSILRFKSASKHWLWLLSDRSFTFRFDKLSKSPGLFLVGDGLLASNIYVPFDVENRTRLSFRSLDFSFDPHGIQILQSCNGLLLCCSRHFARRYYVFNPTTKQSAIIPPVPGGHETIRFMGVAFHQTDCVHYKVICIRALDPVGESYQIQVYSSHTREWKISIQSFSVQLSTVETWFIGRSTFRNGVFWNGAFHWFPSLKENLYFKIDVEKLQSLALPGLKKSFEYIGESRGHLHLIVRNYRRPHSLHVNVYEMLSDHSGWFLKYELELDELVRAFPGMINPFDYTFQVIDVVRGEKDEDTFLVLAVPSGKLISLITFNVHDSSFKEIYTHPDNSFIRLPTFHRYTETLTSF
ncbi:hypothetical protein SSX86_027959 [Deinandra increscens subsp. villosa]|uniref:F-box associated beta-propeller type 1 domain-containing protein n=1 Tax=Deinandra increscens subsp. villosa TaxID=3103831 RepID=A0AAP0CC53_9ASTR